MILCDDTASAAKRRKENVTKTPVLGGVVDRKRSEIVLDEMVLV